MYKYYLEDWGSVGFGAVIIKLSRGFRRFVRAFSRVAEKVVTTVDFLERQTNKLLRKVESRPESEQKKLVEYVFIMHKVLIGLSLILIYLLTSSGSV